MIQRIQSLYLFVSIICLAVVSFGAQIFSFYAPKNYYIFNSYGVQHFDGSSNLIEIKSSLLYLSTIALILLCLLTIFSYKNLSRQLRLGRIILFIYIVLLAGFIFTAVKPDIILGEGVNESKFGLGFYFFLAGFPFIFLANRGIKRDKNLLDSLNRLR